jgi:hypothetical protein
MPDEDWRLQVDLAGSTNPKHLLRELRNPGAAQGTPRAPVGDDVVLTHDGSTLFAYAASEDSLNATRRAIETALSGGGNGATMRTSHWEQARLTWHQTDPPLAEDEPGSPQHVGENDVTTQTLVCSVGKLIRPSFEQIMSEAARDYELKCDIVEHPHLLSTQVAFHLTGSQRSIAEFAECLKSEARSTIRVDAGLLPFGLP